MIGAIFGDIVGSCYEFDNINTTDFELFGPDSHFTDDSVMSLAVCQSMIEGYKNEELTRSRLIINLKKFGSKYPDAGYGFLFRKWIENDSDKPYQSYGNGSAMRVSSVAYVYQNLIEVERYAKISAEITHDTMQGVLGAKIIACSIYLALKGYTKKQIINYLEQRFKFKLEGNYEEIRKNKILDDNCLITVNKALIAFVTGQNLEEVIRIAISMQGDSDTVACIAASLAKAYYGIDQSVKNKVLSYLDHDLKEIVDNFEKFINDLKN